jgi:LysM repeat protein
MPRIVKSILTKFWQIIFKIALVPFYKLFLFGNKKLQKYLVYNPYLTSQQIKTTFKQNTPAHIIIIAIALFALINNFTTRDTYAEEFNKKSIVAQLLISETEEEIVEKPPDFIELKERPKTESVLEQISALESKKNINSNGTKTEEDNKQLALSQGGEALIKPNITPFDEKTSETASGQPTIKEIQYYIVQPGDNLSVIAENFGISINTILWENNLSLSSYIRPGDKLTILPVSGVSYTVQSGDTLSSIAKEFGTTVDKILSFNDLESPSVIKARQKLIIPGGKLGYTAPTRTKSIYSTSSGTPSSNNFLWPTKSTRITQYYHWLHSAIDIGAKLGEPIFASRAGRIERAGWSTGYGYNIIIDHGGGVKTLYAHMSKFYVKRGDQVQQGEPIGEIGSTGWSTGPHVHFEIIINGTKVNPLSYL